MQYHPLGVLIIDFLQHVRRQVKPADIPAALLRDFADIVIEVFVVGFQEAIGQPIRLEIGAGIDAEENPIGVMS